MELACRANYVALRHFLNAYIRPAVLLRNFYLLICPMSPIITIRKHLLTLIFRYRKLSFSLFSSDNKGNYHRFQLYVCEVAMCHGNLASNLLYKFNKV